MTAVTIAMRLDVGKYVTTVTLVKHDDEQIEDFFTRVREAYNEITSGIQTDDVA
jgi:hypothetical protein